MNKRLNFFVVGLVSLFFSLTSHAKICKISPNSAIVGPEEELQFTCEPEDFKVEGLVDSLFVYHLELIPSLAKKERIVCIYDAETKALIARISINLTKKFFFNSCGNQNNFLIDGLEFSKNIIIHSGGDIVFQKGKKIKSDGSFDLMAKKLYLFIKLELNGIFSLKYKEGLIGSHPYKVKNQIKDGFILTSSLGEVRTSSSVRVQLKSLENPDSWNVSSDDFLKTVKEVTGSDYLIKEAFLKRNTEAEKKDYISNYVLNKLNNAEKGKTGEILYKEYFKKNYSEYSFSESKIGEHSFDAIHLPPDSEKGILPIYITEVKYVTDGEPVLGIKKIDGQDWRQLSLPYVKRILEDMEKDESKKELLKDLKKYKDTVHLRLGVFRAKDLILDVYEVGDLKSSQFD